MAATLAGETYCVSNKTGRVALVSADGRRRAVRPARSPAVVSRGRGQRHRERLGGQPDLPGPGAAGRAARPPPPPATRSAGGCQASRRTRSGASRFSTGTACRSPTARPAPPGPRPAGRRRPGRGRPSGSPAAARPTAPRSAAARRRAAAGARPPRRTTGGAAGSCCRPEKTGSRRQVLGRRRVGDRGGDDRAVRQHPAGRDVPLPGQRVPGLPQRPDRGQRPRGRAPGGCRRCAATARPAAAAGERRRPRRTPPAPSPACPVAASSASSRSRSSTSTSTSSAAYASQARGSGRVDQSAAECPFSRVSPSSRSTIAPSPTFS